MLILQNNHFVSNTSGKAVIGYFLRPTSEQFVVVFEKDIIIKLNNIQAAF